MLELPPVEVQPVSISQPVSLRAIAKLFQDLHDNGIRYCHWKSNLRLELSLQAQTDLDLLVDRTHEQRFKQILGEHHIKPVLAAPGKRYPAVEDYLGYDPGSGRLFHLHVHYQLVLGQQFVKNYRLPLEAQFLDSVRQHHGVNIPSPELEIIVLSIRALLKYRSRDAIKDILKIRSPGLPEHIIAEIRSLMRQTSRERIEQTLNTVADVVPGDVVLRFLQTVTVRPRAGYRFYRLQKGVRQALRRFQRHNRAKATITYFHELWRRRNSFLRFSPARKMTLRGRGITLALIGADGAGKSTMCRQLATWLAGKLDVQVFYLGSKEPSRRSEVLYILFRIARRTHRALSHRLGIEHVVSQQGNHVRDVLLYLHHLSIGRDRYRRFLRGRKKARTGSIVIYDRYPLEAINSRTEYRLLDGPQIQQTTNGHQGVIKCAFAQIEQHLYLKMRPPDYIYVLDVSPDVSLQRKPDHQWTTVEAKSRALRDLVATAKQEPGSLNMVCVDANEPFETVLSQLKQHMWNSL